MVGRVEDLLETAAHAVFVIRADTHELLVPATKEVVASVDVSREEMTIRLDRLRES